jgi:hypothetical protein
MPDGSRIDLVDFRDARVGWTLQYSGLSSAEREAFDSFHAAIQGANRTFFFAEPGANLLRWSERMGQAPWILDPLLNWAQDGESSSGATCHRATNAAQTVQGFKQTIDASSRYRYCFSFEAKAESPCELGVFIGSASGQIRQVCRVTSEWSRYEMSGTPGGDSDQVEARMELPAGAIVQFACFQLEIASAASPYQKTEQRCGIYPRTRLAHGEVRFWANGVEDHSITLELISEENSQ